MEDDGLELNIVSAPAPPQPARAKKRSSGKAWDKKKAKVATASKDPITPRQQQQQVDGAAGKKAQGHTHESTVAKAVSIGSTDMAAGLKTTRQQGGSRDGSSSSVNNNNPLAEQPVDLVVAKHATINRTHAPRRSTKGRGHTDAGTPPTKQPSHERQRVLEMAGRPVTFNAPPSSMEAHKKNPANTTNTGAEPGSSPRPTKRKRSSGLAGPVASNGVVDFTVNDTAKSRTRPDKNSRRTAATAAAVAKAMTAMAKSGGKWWDDDDDDRVITKQSPTAASVTKFGWNYGDENGGGEGVEEDKDGGLPSDIHPNSVRTKAVNMDAEASNAMGILATLLGKGGGASGCEESKRLKNGGKSKKRAREPIEIDGASDAGLTEACSTMQMQPNSEVEEVLPSAVHVGGTGDGDAHGQSTQVIPNQNDHVASALTPSADTSDQSGRGSDGNSGDNADKAAGFSTRKTRNRNHGVGKDSVPLPEHHARPRELSRRAAATPLPSARSTHVMAAGPGATFAALGMPPKMVAHLEEPKGEQGGGGMGLVGPTVCQLGAVPMLVAGHNTVVKSETGSGKTLTYLLPLLCDLAAMDPRVDREKGTLAIVLAPTRELSAQILEVRQRKGWRVVRKSCLFSLGPRAPLLGLSSLSRIRCGLRVGKVVSSGAYTVFAFWEMQMPVHGAG